MNRNVGNSDALLRIAVGVILIAYALVSILPAVAAYLPGASALGGWVWVGWIGVVPLATGMVGTCPVYSMMGVSTCSTA